MPRKIDLTKRNATDWEERRLPEPIYGEKEITDEEVNVLAAAHKRLVDAFWPQFSTARDVKVRGNAKAMDAAHAWLSDNATGPWSWSESWSNHGHALDVLVYVERLPDQKAFAEAHAHLFDYRPDEPDAHAKLAIMRGVLPEPTARESLNRWMRENAGFEFLPYRDLGEHGVRVAITHPAIDAAFLQRFGDRFALASHEGRECYEGSTEGLHWRDSPSSWLDRHAAIGDMSGGPTKDGRYVWKLTARYADTVEDFRRDWGHHFALAADGSTFEADGLPERKERPIPEDFLAYLAGERDDYEAPHMPDEVRAFHESRASSPRP